MPIVSIANKQHKDSVRHPEFLQEQRVRNLKHRQGNMELVRSRERKYAESHRKERNEYQKRRNRMHKALSDFRAILLE
jgi:hypothetical protein